MSTSSPQGRGPATGSRHALGLGPCRRSYLYLATALGISNLDASGSSGGINTESAATEVWSYGEDCEMWTMWSCGCGLAVLFFQFHPPRFGCGDLYLYFGGLIKTQDEHFIWSCFRSLLLHCRFWTFFVLSSAVKTPLDRSE